MTLAEYFSWSACSTCLPSMLILTLWYHWHEIHMIFSIDLHIKVVLVDFITSPVGVLAKYCDKHICLSVCLSVCEHISQATCVIFTKFFVHVAYGCGSVLLQQGDDIPSVRGNFGFFPHWQHSIWDPYNNGWTNRHAVWLDEWAWPDEQCVTWGCRSPKGKGQFLGERSGTLSSNGTLWWAVQKRLKRLTCRFGLDEDSDRPKEPCFRWRCRSPNGKGQFWGILQATQKHW